MPQVRSQLYSQFTTDKELVESDGTIFVHGGDSVETQLSGWKECVSADSEGTCLALQVLQWKDSGAYQEFRLQFPLEYKMSMQKRTSQYHMSKSRYVSS